MNFGPPELLIILVIVVILFGVGRLSKIGGELGSGIKAFRQGLADPDEDKAAKAADPDKPAKPLE
jgi:sec-independent protein translocase protein TatA